MEVTLSADLQAKLTRIARDRGTDAEAVAREAIEQLVDYDDWFVREVEKGLTQIERGETLSHEEVGTPTEGLVELASMFHIMQSRGHQIESPNRQVMKSLNNRQSVD